tara:strand:+ start:1131 stop:1442 length:312 start_codon:yes stop_codon:yes gene_type:complete
MTKPIRPKAQPPKPPKPPKPKAKKPKTLREKLIEESKKKRRGYSPGQKIDLKKTPYKKTLPGAFLGKKKKKKKGESDLQTGLKAIKRGTSKSTRDALRMLDNY